MLLLMATEKGPTRLDLYSMRTHLNLYSANTRDLIPVTVLVVYRLNISDDR